MREGALIGRTVKYSFIIAHRAHSRSERNHSSSDAFRLHATPVSTRYIVRKAQLYSVAAR